jgi:hypothetical protein
LAASTSSKVSSGHSPAFWYFRAAVQELKKASLRYLR